MTNRDEATRAAETAAEIAAEIEAQLDAEATEIATLTERLRSFDRKTLVAALTAAGAAPITLLAEEVLDDELASDPDDQEPEPAELPIKLDSTQLRELAEQIREEIFAELLEACKHRGIEVV